jgi:predicted lactoylglutathione lyase
MFKQIFVNLPIENLKRSVDFFTELGFTFNPQFTDEQGTCMIVSEHIYIMLLEKDKFQSFTTKQIADKNTVEALFSFSCDSKEEVVRIAEKAFSLGGKRINDPEDHGFMVSWAFEDLDGHSWDLFWMNPEHVQG